MTKILVVDGSREINELLVSALTPLGYHVLSACSGEEAYKLYIADSEIKAVVTEVTYNCGLKDQYSGVDLALDVMKSSKYRPTPIIFMAGDIGDYSHAELESLTTYMLDKPFRIQDLTFLLDQALHKPAIQTSQD